MLRAGAEIRSPISQQSKSYRFWDLTAFSLALVILMCGCSDQRSKKPLLSVKVGMTRRQVRRMLGQSHPSGKQCSFYRIKQAGTSIVGLRVCFVNDRVRRIQVATHG